MQSRERAALEKRVKDLEGCVTFLWCAILLNAFAMALAFALLREQ